MSLADEIRESTKSLSMEMRITTDNVIKEKNKIWLDEIKVYAENGNYSCWVFPEQEGRNALEFDRYLRSQGFKIDWNRDGTGLEVSW